MSGPSVAGPKKYNEEEKQLHPMKKNNHASKGAIQGRKRDKRQKMGKLQEPEIERSSGKNVDYKF